MEIIENWGLWLGSQSDYARLIPTLIPHGTHKSRLTLSHCRERKGFGAKQVWIKILGPVFIAALCTIARS